MTTRSTTFLHRSRPARGLTLIEVVAAIAILGTVLVGIVLAKARLTHQVALAQRQTAAVRAADELITRWWTSPAGVPMGAQGVMESDPSLLWKTQMVENDALAKLGARVVRVEIREAPSPISPAPAEEETLVEVDVVLPKLKPQTNPPADAPSVPSSVEASEKSQGITREGVNAPDEVLDRSGSRE